MATIRKIEDLQAWKEARELCRMLYRVVDSLPKTEDYNLKKHLRENARGTPANIAEGFHRFFKKERLHLLDVSRGCLGEAKNDCYIAHDNKYISDDVLHECLDQIRKVEALVNGLIRTIDQHSIK